MMRSKNERESITKNEKKNEGKEEEIEKKKQ